MRKFAIASVLALALALPASARADILISPYAGLNFGGSTVDKRVNLGASLAWLGSK